MSSQAPSTDADWLQKYFEPGQVFSDKQYKVPPLYVVIEAHRAFLDTESPFDTAVNMKWQYENSKFEQDESIWDDPFGSKEEEDSPDASPQGVDTLQTMDPTSRAVSSSASDGKKRARDDDDGSEGEEGQERAKRGVSLEMDDSEMMHQMMMEFAELEEA